MYDHVEGDSVEPSSGTAYWTIVWFAVSGDKWVGVALYGSLSVSVHQWQLVLTEKFGSTAMESTALVAEDRK